MPVVFLVADADALDGDFRIRRPVGNGSSGMDISGGGATGQPIVASDAGVVSFVAYHDYGYGYHVEIDHGNGFVTRYAHASDIAVTQGQKVAKAM